MNVVAFPAPAIVLCTAEALPPVIDMIAAGIGGWNVQSIARRMDAIGPTVADREELAIAILESATGHDLMTIEYWRTQHLHTLRAIAGAFGVARVQIDRILKDLPRNVWERVISDIALCAPDHALIRIQIMDNVITNLSATDVPFLSTVAVLPTTDAPLSAAVAD